MLTAYSLEGREGGMEGGKEGGRDGWREGGGGEEEGMSFTWKKRSIMAEFGRTNQTLLATGLALGAIQVLLSFFLRI